MRKKAAALAVAVLVSVSIGGARSIAADPAPNQCYGEVISQISSTWPWAHDNKSGFAPPPGAIALWLELFGPGLGVSTVRELQMLLCD
jgi:hypothetical protein